MAEDHDMMAILESHFNGNGDQFEDQEDKTQVGELMRLMKIYDEFTTIKDSMEMFPLPGNKVEPHLEDNPGFEQQGGNFNKGAKATDLLTSLSLSEDMAKYKIMELAEKSMDEVMKLFAEGEPLWQHDMDRGIEVLNNVEYVKRFTTNLDSTLDEIIRIIAVDAPLNLPVLDGATDNAYKNSSEENSVTETRPKIESSDGYQGTREIGYIQMPATCVVEFLMDVRLWSFVFSEMLSRAAVLGILSDGEPGTRDGALQMMTAEYHAPSPLLPTRHSCFARYYKVLSSNFWAIADISLDTIIDNPLINCKRRPSGCLIHGLPDGNTQITWIEHTEAEMEVIPPLFKPVIKSGLVFSAKHWLDTLSRQCQNLNLVLQHSLSLHKEASPFHVEGLLRLAERMKREFYGALSATKDNKYKPLPIEGAEDILIKTVENDVQDPTLITVTTSSCFPITHKKAFCFLGDEKNRIKWDDLSLGHASQEVFHVRSGQGSDDILSISKLVDKAGNIDTLFLQEKHTNATASYIVFSPITCNSLASLSNQGNIDEIPLLSSGFAILPDKHSTETEESAGSIIVLSFQLLDSSLKTKEVPKRTIRKLYNLVTHTVSRIRGALFEYTGNAEGDVEVCSRVQRKKRLKQTIEGSSINVLESSAPLST